MASTITKEHGRGGRLIYSRENKNVSVLVNNCKHYSLGRTSWFLIYCHEFCRWSSLTQRLWLASPIDHGC